MWVTITRVTGSPFSTSAKIVRQAAAVAGVCRPVSTMVQPVLSFRAQTLMKASWPPSGMRIHLTPGATSIAAPRAGAASKG